MLRFPNPGSTISNFVAVFSAAFVRYKGQVVNLDDIVQAAVDANLATSSGHMGKEAITRSMRADRSRDPLYNQMKMYAELFRSLGWLRSTSNSALNFTFTLLGEQVVAAGRQWKPILGEAVLGMAYPSYVLDVRGSHNVRPFAAILRTMLACDECLSRDEMIVGPLSASSDRSGADMQKIARRIIDSRASRDKATTALKAVEAKRGIQTNTLRNYTRWPIAVLRDLGWAEKGRVSYRESNNSFQVHRLTALGKQKAQLLEKMVDLRIDQVDLLTFDQKRALSRHAHFAMLERAGFDLASVAQQLQRDEETTREALRALGIQEEKPILFSPFQALSIEDSSAIFPAPQAAPIGRTVPAVIGGQNMGRGSRDHLFVKPKFVVSSEAETDSAELHTLKAQLLYYKDKYSSLQSAAHAFANSRRKDRQAQFYPLVTHFFQILGFNSDYSRAGVNYQRWDAFVWLHGFAVPIEIKSPTEELYLSTKAIRQAIENKVILLSRGGINTHRDVSTLIVGYQIPNERGDMSTLIDDVNSTFGFKIGVLDLSSLAHLAMRAAADSVSIEEHQLSHLKGFLSV